jgi:uncharacterized protein YbcI
MINRMKVNGVNTTRIRVLQEGIRKIIEEIVEVVVGTKVEDEIRVRQGRFPKVFVLSSSFLIFILILPLSRYDQSVNIGDK